MAQFPPNISPHVITRGKLDELGDCSLVTEEGLERKLKTIKLRQLVLEKRINLLEKALYNKTNKE